MVASFMATHLDGKNENDDLGAHASWFSRGYENAPAPMPDFITEQKENEAEHNFKKIDMKKAGYIVIKKECSGTYNHWLFLTRSSST